MADEDEEYEEECEEEYVLPIDEEWVPNPGLQFLKMRRRGKNVDIDENGDWLIQPGKTPMITVKT